jgi:putative flippase GtrA
MLVGFIPVGLDYIFCAVIFYFFGLKDMGYSFIETFTIEKEMVSGGVSAAGTAVGYLAGFIASYFLSTYFIFKHNKKAKTFSGIMRYIGIEVFAYGFNVLLGFLLLKVLSYTFAFIARIVISYLVVFTARKFLVFMPASAEEQKKE